MKIFIKVGITLVMLYLENILATMADAIALVGSGEATAQQLENSDISYITSTMKNEIFTQLASGHLLLFITLFLLAILWFPELYAMYKHFTRRNVAVLAVIAITGSFIPHPAHAYYSQQDWAEVYQVLPNHSAFVIPSAGDNLGKQKQFESIDFLDEKKVPYKRIEIKHEKLKNSGAVANYYVPTAMMVLLDRTPYVVSWTKGATGDSPTNQEMCVESQDSIEICFDTSIGANVTEEDAAKYLYWFGTEPTTETGDAAKFPSILFGKSLPNVMNTRVFSRIHTAYFNEFSKYPFEETLAKKSEILKTVEKEMKDEYKKMGITIEYVGIASQFRFDPALQKSMTDLVAADYNSKAAAKKLDAAKTDRYLAETAIMLAKVEPFKKWDGKTFPNVPQFLLSSDSIVAWFKEMASAITSPDKETTPTPASK